MQKFEFQWPNNRGGSGEESGVEGGTTTVRIPEPPTHPGAAAD